MERRKKEKRKLNDTFFHNNYRIYFGSGFSISAAAATQVDTSNKTKIDSTKYFSDLYLGDSNLQQNVCFNASFSFDPLELH